ncbi:bifunctional P-loop containing nucleoside triphosphate hydrolase/AAA+ ATPase domain/Replication factor C [Babesia duncani]|uniref:Bifunctional P-loop containing nucleoside triphosphate hydrolase/AAA+ ATPase domain/Replication factor C n=1 Tax=Babesia duncani TaxID=323732 RepID=A0AAD9UQX1_9APIC|nr:bifunctional P-loop containing nucleoside triphosphate hydrolase/AAA+ ATPase domain/Replication factor C [Babesia duncani]
MSDALCVPWVEKYRPEKFEDIISHEDIIPTLMTFANKGKLPHLLLHGPPGTGKTSTIMAVARYLYGNQKNAFVLELNASDERGIETVREQIKTFSETSNTFNSSDTSSLRTNLKLIILDEADQMTNAAQNSLRRIMEIYSSNVRFCLICNFMNKIIPPIQSRCTGFRFSPLKPQVIKQRTKEIAAMENITVTDCALETLAQISHGDMRRVLNYLQVTSMSHAKATNGVIDSTLILETAGLPQVKEIKELLQTMMVSSFKESIDKVNEMHNVKGYAVEYIVDGLYNAIINMDWPNVAIIQLLIRLGDIEERLSAGATSTIQIAALVSAFAEARKEIERIKFELKFDY